MNGFRATAGPAGNQRAQLLTAVAGLIAALTEAGPGDRYWRVGVDGVDGSGKTTFAAELAAVLTNLERDVVQVSADGFHQVRRIRHRLGRESAEGFWLDSYDYPALFSNVLDPFRPGGDGRYRSAVHDVDTDQVLELPWLQAPARAVLIVDGLFLHRDELAGAWDFSVYLDVPFATSVARMAERDGNHRDPAHPSLNRYVNGQRRYFAVCSPWQRADIVLNNTDLAHPFVTTSRHGLR